MSEYTDKQTAASRPPENHDRWAQSMIERVAFAALVEQRRGRRWSIFFKTLFFLYLVAVLLLIFLPIAGEKVTLGEPHTARVNIEGLIASGAEANAKDIIAGLRSAFEDDKTKGVILQINSPGGSPVQAGEIYDEIMRLRQAHPAIPLYAVASDICASGGYYVAAAAQKIYANRASIIGSIGVRADSFGFVGALDKLGIERRLYTAGKNKGFLDPFLPPDPQDVRHVQNMLDDIHRQFITAVRQGRGERLRETPELFSGLIWTGDKSIELGLVDELADIRYVAEKVIGAKTIVDYTRRPAFFERFLGTVATGLSQALGWEGFALDFLPR